MLMCFAGSILVDFITGSPIFACFDDHVSLLTATLVWYVTLFFDTQVPVALSCVYLHCAGYCEMKMLERLICGVWLPASTEFLHPTFTTKISAIASVIFYINSMDLIPLPDNQLYLAVALTLVYFRMTMIILGLKDFFVPLENIFCTIAFGGMVDALRVALAGSSKSISNVSSGPPGPGSTDITSTGMPSAGSSMDSANNPISTSNFGGASGLGSSGTTSTSLASSARGTPQSSSNINGYAATSAGSHQVDKKRD
ncbi:unnamed protein product [Protopolystoma xenopodis]|uniref:Uncharacterized protein n=1 Tax=Protopolystoma xenopodis TaxID=117903 RepID=A0A3S5AN27_9PLAT|nr:unnamed protein product [Protopolystoma xenopodis]